MMRDRLFVSMILMLAAVNDALAQATPPAGSGAPATSTAEGAGGLTWLWIIIALLIIAGIVWYFMRGRSRTTAAGTTGTPSSSSGTAGDRPHVYDNKTRK